MKGFTKGNSDDTDPNIAQITFSLEDLSLKRNERTTL